MNPPISPQATFGRKRQLVAHRKRVEYQDGTGRTGQTREIRPDHTIENVRPQSLQRLWQSMNMNRLQFAEPTRPLPQADHTVRQQRNAQHMVKVTVADQDVVNAGQLIQPHFTHTAASVDQNVVVQQKSRGVAARRDGP